MPASSEIHDSTPKAFQHPDKALSLPVGAVSPLWLFYAGVTGAGLAYWLMTRWARPVNLESMMGKKAAAAMAPMTEAASAVIETAEDVLVETVAEVESTVEAAVEVVEATVDDVAAAAEASLKAAEAVEPTAETSKGPDVAAPKVAKQALSKAVEASPKPAPKPRAPRKSTAAAPRRRRSPGA